MHRNEEIDGFDLKVRELLGDAEEKVPSRVWGAVSSCLEAEASARKPSSHLWVWATASFALAASLALLLILPSGRVDPAYVPEVAGQLAQAWDPVSFPEKAEDVVYGAATAVYSRLRSSASDSSSTSIHAEESLDVAADIEGGTIVGQHFTDDQDVAATEEGSTPSAPVIVRPADLSEDNLLAAVWRNEDERTDISDRFSFGIDGTLNANDSRIAAGMDARAHMTSGTFSHTMTSIEEESVSAYDIPLSFGLGVRYQFAPRFSVGSGLTYSLIGRSFSGTYYEFSDGFLVKELSGDIRHTMHYLGIPVNFYFDFLQTKIIDCYVYAGGMAEFCVSNRYSIEDAVLQDPVSSPQFSVGAGLGVQFNVTDHLGIYIDPGVRYFFCCDQPKSIRTDQPFMINFEAGLRFNL